MTSHSVWFQKSDVVITYTEEIQENSLVIDLLNDTGCWP